MVWEVDGGSSFLSQNERIAHFGLGQSDGMVDLVTIEWPSGLVQHLHGVSASQTLTVVETDEQAAVGDIDFNGVIDAADVDWLRTAVERSDLYFSLFGVPAEDSAELTGDGNVDVADVDHLLQAILGTDYGDLNLDGCVDQTDLSLWEAGYGRSADVGYADGDIDGDQDVDGFDFLALQLHFGFAGHPITSSHTTPEPTSVVLALATLLCAGRRKSW